MAGRGRQGEPVTDTALDPASLAAHEAVIEAGLTNFIAVGNALTAIRDGGLYKAAGYTSFERYCWERWQLDHNGVYRAMNTAAVSGVLGEAVPESHARELGRLPEELQRAAYEAAAEIGDGKPVARLLKLAVRIAQEAAQEALDTGGYISVGGVSMPLQAAITERMDAAMKEQADSVARHTNRQPPVAKLRGVVADINDSVLRLVVSEGDLSGLADGQVVTVVIYQGD